jgi:hypothetical protein
MGFFPSGLLVSFISVIFSVRHATLSTFAHDFRILQISEFVDTQSCLNFEEGMMANEKQE